MDEIITSRKNAHVQHFRSLVRERAYRREKGLFVCDGKKLLTEAVQNHAEICEILIRRGGEVPDVPGAEIYTVSDEVFSYVSPMENSPGPLFSVRRNELPSADMPRRVLVLENVQDPGNVGTVLRSAAALGTQLVILTGECADPYNPKTVRSAMGALFRQPFAELSLPELSEKLREWELPLYGAALRSDAEDVRSCVLTRAAVAVGNEGHGLSDEMLAVCDKLLLIPMTPGSESLNAAVAASLLMWEMVRGE